MVSLHSTGPSPNIRADLKPLFYNRDDHKQLEKKELLTYIFSVKKNGVMDSVVEWRNNSSDDDGGGAARQARDYYEANYRLINNTIARVAEHNGLSSEEADDFASDVHYKLIKDDYRVLREFKQRSQFRQFLIAVVSHELLDYRIRKWGKWRPSAAAQRMGSTALLMEKLVHRDGYGIHEAIEMARTNHGVKASSEQLREVIHQLPPRRHRLFERPQNRDLVERGEAGNVESRVIERELKPLAERLQPTFSKALGDLSAEQRVLFRLFYREGFTWSQIAKVRGFRRRRLYNAKDAMHRKLRGALEAEGIDWAALERLLENGLLDLKL